jgi:FKBP-type peptidyl-prolyl cis-trans isomerase
LALLTACTSREEYQVLPDGTQWKLLAFEDQHASLDTAALVFMEVFISQPNGDTLDYFYDRGFEPANDSLYDFLRSRWVGDSLEIIRSKRDFLTAGLPEGNTLVYRLRVDRMRSEAELEDARYREMAFLDSVARTDSLRENFEEFQGVFLRTLTEGDTLSVRRGREIVIHYQGRFFNGRVFDDSKRMDSPLRFVFGDEGQVIKGLELALSEMHLREEVEVIIPSWLAFGSRGSAAGHVPPYTPVIYRIKVVEMGI